jgi:hypothetical protein
MVARADGAGAGISKGKSVAQRLAVPTMCGEVMMRCSARLPKAIKKKKLWLSPLRGTLCTFHASGQRDASAEQHSATNS